MILYASQAYKEEDDKMRTTAANAAARVAAGGDDMLSKWQLLAEKNKQRGEGGDVSSGSLPGTVSPHKPSPKAGKGSREQQEIEKRGYFSMLGPGKLVILCLLHCSVSIFHDIAGSSSSMSM